MKIQQKVKTGRGKDRPQSTRCYVPGFLNDDQQTRVDNQQLGLTVQAPIVGNVNVSLKKPSEKKARDVIPGVVGSANGGNLSAVAILDTRRNIGIAKERAEWAKGFSQVSQSVLAVYGPIASRVRGSIPVSAQKGPKEAAAWALANPQGPPAPSGSSQAQSPSPTITQPYTQVPMPQPGVVAIGPSAQPEYILPTPPSQLPGGSTDVPAQVAQPGQADVTGGGGSGSGFDMNKALPLIGLGLALMFGRK